MEPPAARHPPGPLPASAPLGRLRGAGRVLRRGPQRPAPRAAPCRGAGKGRRPPPPPAGKSLLGCNPARARGGRAAPRSLALTHPLTGTSSRALEIPAGRWSAPRRAPAPPPSPGPARARARGSCGSPRARPAPRAAAPRAPARPARARRPLLSPPARRQSAGLSNGATARAGAASGARRASPPPRALPPPGSARPSSRASTPFRVEKPREPRGGPKGAGPLAVGSDGVTRFSWEPPSLTRTWTHIQHSLTQLLTDTGSDTLSQHAFLHTVPHTQTRMLTRHEYSHRHTFTRTRRHLVTDTITCSHTCTRIHTPMLPHTHAHGTLSHIHTRSYTRSLSSARAGGGAEGDLRRLGPDLLH